MNLNTNVILAPMSGCTDLSFRLIAREIGARFCFFEMVDSNSLFYNNRKTLDLLETTKKDSPIAAQLLGRDPDIMLKAAQKITGLANISFLDINSACPVKKVTAKHAGAYLLNDIDRLCKIIEKLASSLAVPITIKIRTGYDKSDLAQTLTLVKKCVKSGASAIFVHGRARSQGYSGDIDYESIKAVKEAVKIPVFGSGNIFNPYMADKMFKETGCDGILVARGALGNPWLFKQIESYLKTGKTAKPPTNLQKLKVLKEHLELINKYKRTSACVKIAIMRKVSMWYLKGLPEACRIRERICGAKTLDGLKGIAVSFLS
jgi:tRNA-dihydrouridine synthase B